MGLKPSAVHGSGGLALGEFPQSFFLGPMGERGSGRACIMEVQENHRKTSNFHLVMTNIAMENGPFMPIYRWFTY
jgi:hypothetical protein